MREENHKSVTLVLGGVRSGKSRMAEKIASLAPRVTYIATATVTDEEMAAKIARHRSGRPAHWRTVEEPVALGEAIVASLKRRAGIERGGQRRSARISVGEKVSRSAG
jgi:adenosylcobinamide kinase/adenosylcobinamide-phosphate guanylyltransferase